MQTIRLKKNEEKRILAGHLWIFSNEIEGFPSHIEPGAIVDAEDYRGSFIGRGYFNPRSLISVRILTREKEEIDAAFFKKKIQFAYGYRKEIFPSEKSYRIVYSEGDFLPGLIIDKYDNSLVIQSLTAGIEKQLDIISNVLKEIFNPEVIIARNDVSIRELEGLKPEIRTLYGKLPDNLIIERNGINFSVDIISGQKTGFFFDQCENYLKLKDIVTNKDVLDGFCYIGGWSLHAARYGAKSVIGIDSSEKAISLAKENASINGFADKCSFEAAEVFDRLRGLNKEGKKFDIIILDPPAFVKSRARIRQAIKGYKEINLQAMKLLRQGGYLITCSCSHHLSQEMLLDLLNDAASDAKKTARLIEVRTQARDHPILLSVKETGYLKCVILQML
ncbi:MAG: class I SAM-dependent rRNA methyltransferase [Nitrospirae bacterium]|nr:class I SAM-dependent rRNA methyltransferase [Nitrospirota bacterium]